MKSTLRFKGRRDSLLNQIIAYSRLDDDAGRSVSKLSDILLAHLSRDDEIVLPLLDTLLIALEGPQYAAKIKPDVVEIAMKLQKVYEQVCSEHREIKKIIEDAKKASLFTHHDDLANLMNSLAEYVVLEERIFYPVAKTLSDIVVLIPYSSVFDPCRLPADRLPEISEFMYGIP